ncbi:MAG: multiheme c-type cytochrome [Thermodesulfobacteriota bacterium]|nr:multiheme c-type cytochrome [Thermodesulfobacteriota bacterium]
MRKTRETATIIILVFLCVTLLGFFITTPAQATNDYAVKTGKGCIFCHQEGTGGSLKVAGFAYIRNGYQYPISERILKKAESLQKPLHKSIRFVIGYIHLLAAVIFFGAIFYIHIFVKPMRLRSGIPRAERILGVSCMLTLTLSGVYLTWVRMDKWEQFINNTFGLMLLIKILLFVVMVAVGVTAITVIHRGMKLESQTTVQSDDGSEEITRTSLGHFDGSAGRPAYVVYENKVYDVSDSAKWEGGRHFGKHTAGEDLTEAMQGAPHGPEMLDNVKYVQPISGERGESGKVGAHQRIFVIMAYANLVIIFLILGCISIWRWGFPVRLLPESRAGVLAGKNCVECHQARTPGIHYDWQASVHNKVGVGCYKCHGAEEKNEFFSKAHLEYDKTPICIVVTPNKCASCHPGEAAQYARSKHANTHEIIWKVDRWLKDGMNNTVERTTGCYACHGTVVKVEGGRPAPGTWPNVGVGRVNPDGSLGSCSSCHTRHKFSVMEARKPEACDQCHLGPDHPQIEIYNESKHGTIYHAEGDKWNWDPDDKHWKAGRDFRAPTCAACHMSTASEIPRTHDVTERLAWETQAPLTVRPSEFEPFPASTDWTEERGKMKGVCLQCHSRSWTDDHFANFDDVVSNYNEIYFKPIEKIINDLYGARLLSKERYFDEPLEWEFYELWHHEGRRARMGAAMMAPDYAWWHGFYELKHRFSHIVETSKDLREKQARYIFEALPGRYSE